MANDTITLLGSDGQEIQFTEIAGIALKGGFYAILKPVGIVEYMDEDEALVLKVTRGPDGGDRFDIVLEDATVEAVFAEYNRLLDEAK